MEILMPEMRDNRIVTTWEQWAYSTKDNGFRIMGDAMYKFMGLR